VAITTLNIGRGTITATTHAAFNYIGIFKITTLIHSNTYMHKLPRRNACNIDVFLTKDVSYNNTCYSENYLLSNHLPIILKFDRVNITKNKLT